MNSYQCFSGDGDMHKVTGMGLCQVYDQNFLKSAYKTGFCSEFTFTVCNCVCDWHVCVTQGAAAISGFYCCWYWLQFWSFRKAPCRRALTWLTSLSSSLGWGLRAERLWHDGFFFPGCAQFVSELCPVLIELQWTHNFFAIFPREISPLRSCSMSFFFFFFLSKDF